jgi:hypothetical protein
MVGEIFGGCRVDADRPPPVEKAEGDGWPWGSDRPSPSETHMTARKILLWVTVIAWAFFFLVLFGGI